MGFRDAKGKLTINPPANLKLEQNTKLIVLGNTNSINKLNTMFRLDQFFIDLFFRYCVPQELKIL